MADFGRHLGIAFQIADDLLDLDGDEGTVGKSLGTDLNKQKPTLPIIRTLAVAKSDDRRALLNILEHPTSGQPARLRPFLQKYDALEYTQLKARHFADLARQQLVGLDDSPACHALRMLTEFVVHRAH
jgi:octaprenyl-diphosphate synthase